MLLFLHSLPFFLSLPCWLLPFSFLCACSHLQRLWSKIISIENPPSTNSMVQSTLALLSLVWSLHDVLHVACQSSPHPFIPVLHLPLRPALVDFGDLDAKGWCKGTAPILCYKIKCRTYHSSTFGWRAMLWQNEPKRMLNFATQRIWWQKADHWPLMTYIPWMLFSHSRFE